MRKLLFPALMALIALSAQAETAYVDGIKYDFDAGTHQATVTRPLSGDPVYTGAIAIPSEVTYASEPYTVVAIEAQAFTSSKATSVSIPASVTSIKANSFMDSNTLAAITVDPANTEFSSQNGVLFNKIKTMLVCFPKAAGTKYTVPNGVTIIGTSAFASSNLTEVILPATITTLYPSAFANSYKLTKIVCQAEAVPTVNTYAFNNVPATAEVRVPLYYAALYAGSKGWKDLTVVTSIDTLIGGINYNLDAFTREAKVIKLPNGAKYTGELTLPKYIEFEGGEFNVTTIGQEAFLECTGLTAIDLPQSLRIIESGAFTSSGLKEIIIPDGVETIRNDAFSTCKSAKKLDIPTTTTFIDNDAFYDCTALEQIICRRLTTPSIGALGAFNGVTKSIPVYVMDESVSIYTSTSPWKSFTNIRSTKSVEIDGLNYDLHVVAAMAEVADNATYAGPAVVIPGYVKDDGYEYAVTALQNYAFQLNTNITSVKIAEGISTIGDRVFDKCYNITSILLPSTLSSIGVSSFASINHLTSITCRATYPPSAGDDAFTGTPATATLYVPAAGKTDYTVTGCAWSHFTTCSDMPTTAEAVVNGINYRFDLENFTATVIALPSPNKYSGKVNVPATVVYDYDTYYVTAVGNFAFAQCNDLTAITLPEGVMSIGNYAFSEALFLEEVNLPSTLVSFGNYVFNGCAEIKKIILPASTMPIVGTDIFQNVNTATMYLYVPYASLSTYKANAPWSGFKVRDLNELVTSVALDSSIPWQPELIPVGFVWNFDAATNVAKSITLVDSKAPYRVPESMCNIYKWNGSTYAIIPKSTEGTALTEGSYKICLQVYIGVPEGNTYRFPYEDEGDISVTVAGKTWSIFSRYVGEGFSHIFIMSPEFKIGTATDVDQTTNDLRPMTNKVLRNGQVLIIRDGRTYNILGAEVE